MDWKRNWIIVVSLIAVFWAIRIPDYILADYQYENQYAASWSLADKASTLDQKFEYIDRFTNTLAASNMRGTNNAIWLKTPDNSFDMNFQALTSLRSRLAEIRSMNPKSFEYQQAISQITAQEQGEAGRMLEVFNGCWMLQNHFYLWDWVGDTISVVAGLIFIFSLLALLIICMT